MLMVLGRQPHQQPKLTQTTLESCSLQVATGGFARFITLTQLHIQRPPFNEETLYNLTGNGNLFKHNILLHQPVKKERVWWQFKGSANEFL